MLDYNILYDMLKPSAPEVLVGSLAVVDRLVLQMARRHHHGLVVHLHLDNII